MRRIIKKIGGDRIGSGGKMNVTATGYGYSTHDVGSVLRTSISFGTVVPAGMWLLTPQSRLRLRLDALTTSNALLYQLYGSAKFQVDVFTTRLANYMPKMLLNLNDMGYTIDDILFPLMELTTKNYPQEASDSDLVPNWQINKSSLLAYLGIVQNGGAENMNDAEVTRKWNALWLHFYYQTIKEYYANKQEKLGWMIHNEAVSSSSLIMSVTTNNQEIPTNGDGKLYTVGEEMIVKIGEGAIVYPKDITLIGQASAGEWTLEEIYGSYEYIDGFTMRLWDKRANVPPVAENDKIYAWYWSGEEDTPVMPSEPQLVSYDLKAIDRMMMKLMTEVESDVAHVITGATELPYGASFKKQEFTSGDIYAINGTQEGLCLKTYQSDVFNNWLDNATIQALSDKNKVKIDAEGNFSIDLLNLTQKQYNYDMRIGVTDGTLEEWREMTYGQVSKSKSLKPVYEGGLSKEIVFDMVVSTASTDEDPLGSIASRGQFGSKHKGGYVQIDTDEEKMVMVLVSITPRLVYSNGNHFTNNFTSLNDMHKPAFDRIGYQNLLSENMAGWETQVKADGTLITFSVGKQPAFQWWRTSYDRALGNMAGSEDYKVFGREYEAIRTLGGWKIKDLTTYVDPRKFNDVFAIESLDAQNFDIQVGMDATLTMVMSEEVIPTL